MKMEELTKDKELEMIYEEFISREVYNTESEVNDKFLYSHEIPNCKNLILPNSLFTIGSAYKTTWVIKYRYG